MKKNETHQISRRDALMTGPLAAAAAFVGLKPEKSQAKIPPYPQLPDPNMPIIKLEDLIFVVTLNVIVASFAKVLIHRSNQVAPGGIAHTLRDIHRMLLTATNWKGVALSGHGLHSIMTEVQVRKMLEDTFLRFEVAFADAPDANRKVSTTRGLEMQELQIGPLALLREVAHDVRMTEWGQSPIPMTAPIGPYLKSVD